MEGTASTLKIAMGLNRLPEGDFLYLKPYQSQRIIFVGDGGEDKYRYYDFILKRRGEEVDLVYFRMKKEFAFGRANRIEIISEQHTTVGHLPPSANIRPLSESDLKAIIKGRGRGGFEDCMSREQSLRGF